MKKSVLISGCLLLGFASNSQVLISLLLGDRLNTGKVEFGLEGGVNWSTVKNLDGAKDLAGFNLGFYFDIKLKNPSWMLNTGVMVKSSMGADHLPVYLLNNRHLDSAFVGGSVTRKIGYFNVPVMLKYMFSNNLFLSGGIQLGLRNKSVDEFSNSINDKDDLRHTIKIKDQIHPLDAGLAFGIGYRLMKGNGINLNLKYYYGFIDVVIEDSIPDQFNRVFYLTAGIPIRKNPKNKGQTEQ